MEKADSGHKLVYRAALKASNMLRKVYEKMPKNNLQELEAVNAVKLKSVRAYRGYLLYHTKPRKVKAAYWPRAISGLYDLGQWAETEDIIEKMLKRYGTKLPQKLSKYAKRRQARCIMERAKTAFFEDKTDEADRLFAIAAPVYTQLVGEKNTGTTATLEEAAQIFGGFLTDEDRKGRRKFYKGNGEFARSAKIWKKLQRRFATAADKAESGAEQEELEHSVQKARVYTFLMVYQDAKSRSDNRGLERLKRNVSAVFQKSPIPGGKRLVGIWEWLRDQL